MIEVITALFLALAAYMLGRTHVRRSIERERTHTTHEHDTERHHAEEQEAIEDAIRKHPDADPRRVSDLRGIADRERGG